MLLKHFFTQLHKCIQIDDNRINLLLRWSAEKIKNIHKKCSCILLNGLGSNHAQECEYNLLARVAVSILITYTLRR